MVVILQSVGDREMTKDTKMLILLAVFVTVLVFISLTSAKLATLFGFTVSISVFFYALTFPITDVISECWGKNEAKRVVWIGFAVSVFATILTLVARALPPDQMFATTEPFFDEFFGLVPRIVSAGLIAYVVSQFHDVWAFHFWKNLTKGKHLWLRNNASTIVSQFIDAVLFIGLAFYAVVPDSVLLQMIVAQYLFKVVIAVLDTPLVYLLRSWVRSNYV